VSAQPKWDVIVIGAGPAGSTTAALLAKQGVRVLVLEKDEFPRFHIGESLLPASNQIKELLGVEFTPDIFRFKRGAQFVDEATSRVAIFDFKDALPGPPRNAYHVERAKFDTLLRDRALAYGAQVRHGVRVQEVDIDADEVRVRTDAGEERARFLVDASGQDRFLGGKKRSIEPFRHFGKAASFTHFDNLSAESVAEFEPYNDIRIMMLQDGWAWVIPLAGPRLSVGIVSRKQGIRRDDILSYIASSKLLTRWTQGAERGPTRLIGNFSFRNTQPYGVRYACVGDSACFIDPVFSSGVSLAIMSAKAVTDLLVPALAAGTEADPNLCAPFSTRMQPAYDTFCSMVYRFYNTRLVENFMFGAPAEGAMRASVISVLGGDVLRPDNPFRDMLLSSRMQPWVRNDDNGEPAPGYEVVQE
jgi:flavin-dependent dehydrogenase